MSVALILLKDCCVETPAPFLTKCFSPPHCPPVCSQGRRSMVVLLRLKQPGLEQAKPANHYRPVSYLPFLSKLLERIVNKQLVTYLTKCRLLPMNESANRKGHSTETAILKFYNDIINAIVNGQVALLCLLDLPVAFDSLDHGILLRRLETTYGRKDTVPAWVRST